MLLKQESRSIDKTAGKERNTTYRTSEEHREFVPGMGQRLQHRCREKRRQLLKKKTGTASHLGVDIKKTACWIHTHRETVKEGDKQEGTRKAKIEERKIGLHCKRESLGMAWSAMRRRAGESEQTREFGPGEFGGQMGKWWQRQWK